MREYMTMDGNTAVAYISYAFTDIAAIYPITPSSTMADLIDKWSNSKKNLFDDNVLVKQMQSEAGAAGALHGALISGAYATTYTASQGLLLMIPNMYKIAGEFLPAVIHVAARTIATHALSIYCDHSDVYAARQTGFCILSTSSVQEAMDLSPLAHICAMISNIPFLHFFDGFRTSHEIQKIKVWSYEDLKDMLPVDSIKKFRNKSLNPERPKTYGSAQGPDTFFQIREASNKNYNDVIKTIEETFKLINKKINTNYDFFDYYGSNTAKHIIVAMGSVCETIKETIDYLNNDDYGLITVHIYRPFNSQKFLEKLPKSVEIISVLDRTKEAGSAGEPLYLDVIASVFGKLNIKILGGRYGLSSKDTTPEQIIAVFNNKTKNNFTIGIIDDITNLSLPIIDNQIKNDSYECLFYGRGADGTISANKNTAKILGKYTDYYVQAYFDYDSKKSGGYTISHLRFNNKEIKSTYLIQKANFIAVHHFSYFSRFEIINKLKPKGILLINTNLTENEILKSFGSKNIKYLITNEISVYTIDANKIAEKLKLGNKINTILQSAFFNITNLLLNFEEYMQYEIKEAYSNKGEEIIYKNFAAIKYGKNYLKLNLSDLGDNDVKLETKNHYFIDNILKPISKLEGNNLPVSTFINYNDGSMENGSTKYEKRYIATHIPRWNSKNCIQCNFCSYVCPHAAIRPVAIDENFEVPEGMKMLSMMGLNGKKYAIVVSAANCTGCGICVQICPGKNNEKALEMVPIEEEIDNDKYFDFTTNIPIDNEVLEKFKVNTVKGSQFRKPLLEFSGACAGCGETPYAKLITQLFGEKMFIANATGCSSIWGATYGSTPYTKNLLGHGPAFANSLFEDNAEFGFGMYLAYNKIRQRLINKLLNLNIDDEEFKNKLNIYLETKNSTTMNTFATNELISILKKYTNNEVNEILELKEYLSKKSQWIFGGDGWAYDIGFSGIDHIIAQGEDVNIFIFDTESYSNTGGQISKSTPIGAIGGFAYDGKKTPKKDLASIAMTYENVYVASISQGADYNQCLKAIIEAESYEGPSIIIAYSSCIEHGIQGGMQNAKISEKKAVESGYWPLFRYDPRRIKEGKSPLQLDSKKPKLDYASFIQEQLRFSNMNKLNPKTAKILFNEAKISILKKYEHLYQLSIQKPFEISDNSDNIETSNNISEQTKIGNISKPVKKDINNDNTTLNNTMSTQIKTGNISRPIKKDNNSSLNDTQTKTGSISRPTKKDVNS